MFTATHLGLWQRDGGWEQVRVLRKQTGLCSSRDRAEQIALSKAQPSGCLCWVPLLHSPQMPSFLGQVLLFILHQPGGMHWSYPPDSLSSHLTMLMPCGGGGVDSLSPWHRLHWRSLKVELGGIRDWVALGLETFPPISPAPILLTWPVLPHQWRSIDHILPTPSGLWPDVLMPCRGVSWLYPAWDTGIDFLGRLSRRPKQIQEILNGMVLQ